MGAGRRNSHNHSIRLSNGTPGPVTTDYGKIGIDTGLDTKS